MRRMAAPDAAPAVLGEVHAIVTAYESIVRHYPGSGYGDDALWLAGRLSLDAFARFGQIADKETGVRLLKKLTATFPTSRLAKLVPEQLAKVSHDEPAGRPEGRPLSPAPNSAAAAVPTASPSAGPGRQAVSSDTPNDTPGRRAGSNVAANEGAGRPDGSNVRRTRSAAPRRARRPRGSRASRPSAEWCCPMPCGSRSSSMARCRFTKNAFRIRRACSSISRHTTGAGAGRSDAALRRRRGHRPPDSRRPAPEQHDEGRARCRQRDQLQRVSALQSIPSRHRLRPSPSGGGGRHDDRQDPRAGAADGHAAGAPEQRECGRGPRPPRHAAGASSRRRRARRAADRAHDDESLAAPTAGTKPTAAAMLARAREGMAMPPSAAGAGRKADADDDHAGREDRGRGANGATTARVRPRRAAPKLRPRPPAPNAAGGLSMARQLGLGVSRIVIDPGHGGHDPGAKGKGITEAELVLDVALRLEKLLKKSTASR